MACESIPAMISILADAATADVVAPVINQADTAWQLVAAALVLLMTPALAFFYGGLVRSKNMLNTMMMSFIACGVVGVLWAIVGFSLSFSGSNAYIGNFDLLGLKNVALTPRDANSTVPHLLFMAYQATFAIITPALISGAVVERIKFLPYLIFISLWSLLVYCPVAHWVWGGGWLSTLGPEGKGALDFAGGTVVHINAGIAALVAAMVVGRRKDFGRQAMLPHNVPLVLLGAGVLWFGWFGFNGGSGSVSGGTATQAFVNTLFAPCATLMVWAIIDLIRTGKVTSVGAATGIVVGLVAITPAAGFVSPMSAIALGAIAAIPSYFAILLRASTRLDDSLDVVAAHGLGGLTGALLTGVFASKAWNSPVEGGLSQFVVQAIGAAAAIVYSGVLSFVLLKGIGLVMPLRASDHEQGKGMDVADHGEEAYTSGEGAVLILPEESRVTGTPVTHTQPAKA